MLDWIVVGGGIHGVHLAVRLLTDAGVSRDRLRIVDPGERLLARGCRAADERPARKLRLVAICQPLDSSPVAQLHNERLVRGSGWRQAGERLAARDWRSTLYRPQAVLFAASRHGSGQRGAAAWTAEFPRKRGTRAK